MKATTKAMLLAAAVMVLAAGLCHADQLKTRWTDGVTAMNAHLEYPRPQMVRDTWMNLNGSWDYTISAKDAGEPSQWQDKQVLVPFAPTSYLSGVNVQIAPDKSLWMRKNFVVPKDSPWRSKRIMLHFEAVDWETKVWVNGKKMGAHKGGYDPFSFDITDALNKKGTQQIILKIWDPTDAGTQAIGKQRIKPRGIYYSMVTGIWQTVWLEPVSSRHITGLKIVPDFDNSAVKIKADIDLSNAGSKGYNLKYQVIEDGKVIAEADGGANDYTTMSIPNAKAWSPDDPYLYDVEISLVKKGLLGKKTVDTIDSYFGMRKISVEKDSAGVNRLFLNGEVLFQYGPLDQGWWPDGLYTAPSDEALRYDIEMTKKAGFNMLRKHVKVESRRFYYWCDKLGILVWQDMPSTFVNRSKRKFDPAEKIQIKQQFEAEYKAMIDHLYSHPSIVMWVVFNEGWGQYDEAETKRIVEWTKAHDPSRLVSNASGWTDRNTGDIMDVHCYPGPCAAANEPDRAVVLGEFGGLGLSVAGHLWKQEGNFSYQGFEGADELRNRYRSLLMNLHPLIGDGVSAAVYTQTTDVEGEINGLMTYDREIFKMGAEECAKINQLLNEPPPKYETVLESSQKDPKTWRYTFDQPDENWQKSDFDDSAWKEGKGGFGTKGTPGANVNTVWDTENIWIRREFDLEDNKIDNLLLYVHHDEDAQVFINGKLVAKLKRYTTSYNKKLLKADASKALKKGKNIIAIHCRQTKGGQYIDAGLVKVAK